MNPTLRDALAEELYRQRAVLVGEVADTEADLRFIQEDRESELEERAQEQRGRPHSNPSGNALSTRGERSIWAAYRSATPRV